MAEHAGHGFTTRAVHGGHVPDENKSMVTPIYQTATFRYDTVEEGARLGAESGPGYFYTRWANPTTDMLEQKVALLEGAEAALAVSSGMAAISTAVVGLLRAGDHVVAPKAVYQATFELLHGLLPRYGVEATFLDDPDVSAYERAIRPNTKLLYIETPNNPLLGVTDITGVVALAKACGARTVADNTFATPYNQTPLALGVDLVCHSATKYLGGHHDVTAGVICGPRDLIRQCVRTMRIFGGVLDPFAAYLLVRGIMTLGLRMERHNASALALARHLAAHPAVARVHYPGPARPPAPRDRLPPDARRIRRDDEHRGARRRRGRGALRRGPPRGQAGREPRRRQHARDPSRVDDEREHAAGGAPRRRHRGRTDSDLGRHRGPRRPDRRL